MEKIQLSITAQEVTVQSVPRLVAGSQGIYSLECSFDSSWSGFAKVAVFRCGTVTREALLISGKADVPRDVLIKGMLLRIGVYGTKEGALLPTLWALPLMVEEGAEPYYEVTTKDTGLIQQILNAIGDLDALGTEDKSCLVAAINEVLQKGEDADQDISEIIAQMQVVINGYTNEIQTIWHDMRIFRDEMEEAKSDIADLQYKPIEILSLTNTVGNVEVGRVINAVNLQWTLNKPPTEMTLNGESLEVSGGTSFVNGFLNLGLTQSTRYLLAVKDERDAEASKSTWVNFLPGVFYGAAEAPESLDSGFILGLASKTLTSTRKRTFTVDAAEGQYIWYCLPESQGACSFWVGGFEGGFSLVDTLNFTNSYGHTESYRVYRSDNLGLGNTTVEVT